MTTIEEVLAECKRVVDHPYEEIDKHIANGKKVIGVMPYYIPEELVYAAGAIPFGVWGCRGTASEAQKYFPSFYCSICQMTLEMGLTHKLDKLSAIMITGLCDTLKAMSQNWKAGVSQVPMIYVSQPQNRFIDAGLEYTEASYRQVARKVEECAHGIIDDLNLHAAIALYNKWRAEMRRFVELAGNHPAQVSVEARTWVVDAGYYMDKAEHLELVRKLNDALVATPQSQDGFCRVIVSGVYEDIPAISKILDANKIDVVADDIAKESRAFAVRVSEDGDPIKALAAAWCAVSADSIAFDPEKTHIDKVVDLVKDSNAQGVVVLRAKFCDPEEFDSPLIEEECKKLGVPCVVIEIDQSTESYEQARTQIETFKELIA